MRFGNGFTTSLHVLLWFVHARLRGRIDFLRQIVAPAETADAVPMRCAGRS